MLLTAKQGSRLLAANHPDHFYWARASCWLLNGRQRLTLLGGKHILGGGNLNDRSPMQPDHQKDQRAAALGSLGGMKRKERLSAKERSAIAKLGAQARHHPLVFQAERERAQRQAYLIQQILKDDKQLPLV